jgi:CHAD domain-containing protein
MAAKQGSTIALRELEAKFRVHSPFELPAIAGVAPDVASVDEPRQFTMTAVYYDTADLRLAREGVTLRRRSGGKDAGWHLKLPVLDNTVPDGTGARDEIQLPDAPELPGALSRLVTVWVRTATLGPVATLVTERTKVVLRGKDGAELAELVDDTVSVEDNNNVQARFREIEVEDTGGGERVVAQVATVLQDAGAVGGEFVPKVVRALGPRATAPQEPPPPHAVEARDPAYEVVASTLRRHTRQLMAEDVRVRRDLPDAVHQMRVATRRLRGALETFAPLLDGPWAYSLMEELRWLADTLGAARDTEVLLARLVAASDRLPESAKPDAVRAKLAEICGKDLGDAMAAARLALQSERYVDLIDRLVDAASYPRTSDVARRPAGSALLPLVRSTWARLHRRAMRVTRPRHGGPSAVDYHRVRIAAKKVRYACDAVAPALGPDATKLSKQAERVQEVLGEHQDAVVAARFLADVAARPRIGFLAFGIGVLFAREEEAAAAARAEFAEIWPDVAGPKRRRWLAN